MNQRESLIDEYGPELITSYERLFGPNYEIFEEKFCGYYPEPEAFGQEVYQSLYGHIVGKSGYKTFREYMEEEFFEYYYYDDEMQVVYVK